MTTVAHLRVKTSSCIKKIIEKRVLMTDGPRSRDDPDLSLSHTVVLWLKTHFCTVRADLL